MWIDFGRLLGKAFVLGIAVGPGAHAGGRALPSPLQEEEAQAESPRLATSGRFLMRRASGEGWTMAPNLATEASFRVAGVVARATVRQRFQNATDGWVEGVYVFPLPENAAVDHLLMKVGEREIEGQIREREQAKAEYQQAKSEGKKASLVEQERPNLFTTSVANLGPGETLVVEIEFQQTLSFDEGEVRLRLPLVVGPRYIPGQATDEKPFGLGWALDTDLVPDASRVTPPLVKAASRSATRSRSRSSSTPASRCSRSSAATTRSSASRCRRPLPREAQGRARARPTATSSWRGPEAGSDAAGRPLPRGARRRDLRPRDALSSRRSRRSSRPGCPARSST
jgi:hypothetical protein